MISLVANGVVVPSVAPLSVPPGTPWDIRTAIKAVSQTPALTLIYGHPHTARLAHYFLLPALVRQQPVVFVDGANCFDAYLVSRFARRRGLEARAYLRLIYVSRAFTCYQLAELVARTPAVVARSQARLAVMTGLPDILYDEEIAVPEARRIFARMLQLLRRLSQTARPVAIFANNPPLKIGTRMEFLERLKLEARAVYKVTDQESRLAFFPEKVIYGTHRTDLYPNPRSDVRALDEVPPRATQGRPGSLRPAF